MTIDAEKLFLNLSDWYVERQIEEFAEYVKAMERLIAGDLAREEAELAVAAAQLAPADRPDYYADNAEYLQLLADTFTNRLRLSSITMAHSIIERRIVRVAKELGKGKAIQLKDLGGHSPIEKSKKYLESFIGADLSEISWDHLKQWSKLRNVIVHSDGEISSEDLKELQPLERRFPTLISFTNDRVVISQDLVRNFIAEISEINKKLAESLAIWHTARAP